MCNPTSPGAQKTRALRVKGLSDFFTRDLALADPGIVAASRISNFRWRSPRRRVLRDRLEVLFPGSSGTTRTRDAPLSAPAAANTFPAWKRRSEEAVKLLPETCLEPIERERRSVSRTKRPDRRRVAP
jgi:hypothetical protein